jgi:hypothetical protein
MVYTFTYADCAGHTHDWTYTYTLLLLISRFQLMVLQPLIVPSDAVAPTPPAVTDAVAEQSLQQLPRISCYL